MLHSVKNATIVNNSSEVAQNENQKSLLEILPKVEKIGMDLECKIDNLTKTKSHLFGILSETMEKLPNSKLKDDLQATMFQIMTIDDVLAECMTTDDFFNLDNFIFHTKKLLTQKTA